MHSHKFHWLQPPHPPPRHIISSWMHSLSRLDLDRTLSVSILALAKGWEKKKERKRLNFKTFISFRTIGVIASGEHGQRMLSPRERVIVMKVGQLALDNRVRFKYSSLLCSQPRAPHGICKWWRLGRRGTKWGRG